MNLYIEFEDTDRSLGTFELITQWKLHHYSLDGVYRLRKFTHKCKLAVSIIFELLRTAHGGKMQDISDSLNEFQPYIPLKIV